LSRSWLSSSSKMEGMGLIDSTQRLVIWFIICFAELVFV